MIEKETLCALLRTYRALILCIYVVGGSEHRLQGTPSEPDTHKAVQEEHDKTPYSHQYSLENTLKMAQEALIYIEAIKREADSSFWMYEARKQRVKDTCNTTKRYIKKAINIINSGNSEQNTAAQQNTAAHQIKQSNNTKNTNSTRDTKALSKEGLRTALSACLSAWNSMIDAVHIVLQEQRHMQNMQKTRLILTIQCALDAINRTLRALQSM